MSPFRLVPKPWQVAQMAVRQPNPQVRMADIEAENQRGPQPSRQMNGCVTTEGGMKCCTGKDGYWWCEKKVDCEPGEPGCYCMMMPGGGLMAGKLVCSATATWRPGVDPEPTSAQKPLAQPRPKQPVPVPPSAATPRSRVTASTAAIQRNPLVGRAYRFL